MNILAKNEYSGEKFNFLIITFSDRWRICFWICPTKAGIFVTRFICGMCTTAGLILFIFYESVAYFIYPAMILISFPSVMYLVTNSTIAPIFPSISTIFLVLVSGTFDASSGVFLILKVTG